MPQRREYYRHRLAREFFQRRIRERRRLTDSEALLQAAERLGTQLSETVRNKIEHAAAKVAQEGPQGKKHFPRPASFRGRQLS